jgi:flagellar assembly protein FliH/type III secretion protein L
VRLGRVVAAVPELATTTAVREPTSRLGRVEGREVLEAVEKARAIVARAEAEARAVVARAEAEAAELAQTLAARARTEAARALAARELVLASRESTALERELENVVSLARLLAERLLGEALALDPTRVVALARQALAEARGARRVTIAAHPEDVPLLEHALAERKLAPPLTVVADRARARGHLRLETDIGTLDAELAPELDRLTEKLREALAHG